MGEEGNFIEVSPRVPWTVSRALRAVPDPEWQPETPPSQTLASPPSDSLLMEGRVWVVTGVLILQHPILPGESDRKSMDDNPEG